MRVERVVFGEVGGHGVPLGRSLGVVVLVIQQGADRGAFISDIVPVHFCGRGEGDLGRYL